MVSGSLIIFNRLKVVALIFIKMPPRQLIQGFGVLSLLTAALFVWSAAYCDAAVASRHKAATLRSAVAPGENKSSLKPIKVDPKAKSKKVAPTKNPPVSKAAQPPVLKNTNLPAPVIAKKPVAEIATAPQVLYNTSLTALRSGLDAAARGDIAQVAAIQAQVSDVAAKKLLSWTLYRSNFHATLAQLKSFVNDPSWPTDGTLKFKIEQELLQGNYGSKEIISYFGANSPSWPQGYMALAAAMVQIGQIDRANKLIHECWRKAKMSAANEKDILQRFPGVVSYADKKFRMDALLYKENIGEASRIAKELGGDAVTLANARIAVIKRVANAGAVLDAVPSNLRKDPGYIFASIQFLRRQERFKDAIDLMLAAPSDAMAVVDGDEWWTERRLLARSALEMKDFNAAYRLAAHHSSESPLENMEAEFHAGWIALRFLNNAAIADKHFIALAKDAERPISASRGAYWRGRAAEASGRAADANTFYQAAARNPTTYYGQLSLVKLGHGAFSLKPKPVADASSRQAFEQRDAVRALKMLMAMNDNGKTHMFMQYLSKTLKSPQELTLLAELATQTKDVRDAVTVGKEALYRSLPLDVYAFPTTGLPNIPPTNGVERALALAIARQESVFDPNIKSGAGAVGLFQVLPTTARDMAKRSGLKWEPSKITDPVYNMQLGTAYLDKLINDNNGSYILTIASYNAGPGRIREWLQRFGDPRNKNVDAIDWVESIPFTETRNYVMRVMENLQVYRARLSNSPSSPTVIDRDMNRGQI